MLAAKYKFVLDNQADQPMTITGDLRPWKYDAAGALEYGANVPIASASIGAGSQGDIQEFDNSVDLYLGGHARFVFDWTSTVGSGDLKIYLLLAPNGTDYVTILTEILVAATSPADLASYQAEI